MSWSRPPRPVVVAGALVAGLLVAGLGLAGPACATDDPTQDGLWYYNVPGFEQLHASGITGQGITIAVIDGPINPDVPDLVGTNLITRPDSFCDQNSDGTPDPAIATTKDAEHATGMAALLLGTGIGVNGQPGTRGIAPGTTVRHYAHTTTTNNGCELNGENSVALAIDQAVTDGADIISMSFSGFTPDEDALALARAERAGVVVVVASNNRGGTDLGWPASANGVISVENADVNQQLGPNAVTNPLLTVVAPGVDVRVPGVVDGDWNRYAETTGSSQATVWTAGVLALAWSAHPEATGNQMIQALLRTTGESNGELVRVDDRWGYGSVSLHNLMDTDPTTFPDTNPLLRNDPDAQPTYEQIMGTAPTTGPTRTSEPTTRPGPDDVNTDPLLLVGVILVILVVVAAIMTAVVLTRRSKQPTPPAPPATPYGQ